LTFAGCGPSGAPRVVKAKLKAEFEDGTALPSDATLILHPEGGAATKYVVSLNLPENGEYAFLTSYEGVGLDGAPPGKYKVTVQVGAGLTDTPGPKPTPECGSEATTPLKIEVTDSGTVTPNPLKVPRG
jgi:hypothetical protein